MSQNPPEFDLCYNFWRKFDIIGSMTWDIVLDKIVIEFYFNDENMAVEIMPYILNKTIRETPRLLANGWKPNFRMFCSNLEEWIEDFHKKVKFVFKK